ncbi:hypothetical protein NEOLEDRAFT_1234526, partial [Neolentinus lepideus HHB14362 ss-1]
LDRCSSASIFPLGQTFQHLRLLTQADVPATVSSPERIVLLFSLREWTALPFSLREPIVPLLFLREDITFRITVENTGATASLFHDRSDNRCRLCSRRGFWGTSATVGIDGGDGYEGRLTHGEIWTSRRNGVCWGKGHDSERDCNICMQMLRLPSGTYP